MPRVLGFQKWNAELVRAGWKQQTMRAPSKTLPAAGDVRMFYSGLRTRSCTAVFPEPVTIESVEPVILDLQKPYHIECVTVGGEQVCPDRFAARDGFDLFKWRAKGAWFPDGKARWVEGGPDGRGDRDVMGVWLRRTHPAAFEAGVLEAYLIRWTPPRSVLSMADYRAYFGAPIDAKRLSWVAEAFGWSDRTDDGALPAEMPADLRQALGGALMPGKRELPGELARIAEVAGLPAVMALAEQLGGTSVHVARRPRAGTKLVDAVGPSAAHAIAAEFGGETIAIPRARPWLIAHLLDHQVPIQEIARRLKIDRNTVARRRDQLRQDTRQGSLFDAL